MNLSTRCELAVIGVLFGGLPSLKADGMPGLNKEVKVLAVEPGQTVQFEIEFSKVYDKSKPDTYQGLALWFHQDERLMAFWTNVPLENNPSKYDVHGGLVSPTIGGKNGSFEWKNDSKRTVLILVNSFQGTADNCTRLQLL